MKRGLLLLCVLMCFDATINAQDYAAIANSFISSLDKDQQLKALFPFDSDERFHFHFYPKDDRKGISFNAMNSFQTEEALKLIQSCLSNGTVRKIGEIRSLENVLKTQENRAINDHYRDSGKYYISIFGIPAPGNIWGWRLEGHHITFNFTTRNNILVSGAPGFLGSNPGIVQSGDHKGLQILKDEADGGFKLLKLLSQQQLQKAKVDEAAPNEIITFINRHAMDIQPGGIHFNEMSHFQQEDLLALIKVYVNRYTKLLADDLLKEIQHAGLNNISFAWAGATDGAFGKPYYYRIQGPTFIIEFDNSQNNANHVHSIYRDIKNDFGDELLDHYKNEHKN